MAMDHGVNFFDNAWDYHKGESKLCLGVALKGKRDQAIVMTKVCTHGRDKTVGIQVLVFRPLMRPLSRSLFWPIPSLIRTQFHSTLPSLKPAFVPYKLRQLICEHSFRDCDAKTKAGVLSKKRPID